MLHSPLVVAPFSLGDFIQGPVWTIVRSVDVPTNSCVNFKGKPTQPLPLAIDRHMRSPFIVASTYAHENILAHSSHHFTFRFISSSTFTVRQALHQCHQCPSSFCAAQPMRLSASQPVMKSCFVSIVVRHRSHCQVNTPSISTKLISALPSTVGAPRNPPSPNLLVPQETSKMGREAAVLPMPASPDQGNACLRK